LEYNQPALVAEALAMACVHDPDSNKIAPIFTESEKLAGGPRQSGKKTLRQIMEEIRESNSLRASIDGENAIDRTKNVADNAGQEMIKYAAQYSISDDQLENRMNEMIDTVCKKLTTSEDLFSNTANYFYAALLIATKPSPIKDGQRYKTDFFLLHSVNTLAMMPSLIKHEWISRENGVRMIEWAGRCHLLTYVAQTAPPITSADIDNYQIKRPWNEIFDRAINHPSDDGHLQKCIRSLAFGEKVWEEKYDEADHQIKPDAWLRLANLGKYYFERLQIHALTRNLLMNQIVVDLVPYEAKTSEQRWLLMF
jgi:Questin oxidase-like